MFPTELTRFVCSRQQCHGPAWCPCQDVGSGVMKMVGPKVAGLTFVPWFKVVFTRSPHHEVTVSPLIHESLKAQILFMVLKQIPDMKCSDI